MHPRIAAACVFALCVVGTTIAGIQGSGLRRLAAFGIITSTGDITVNGTTYSSAHARVTVNGHASDTSHLHVGQVVSIEGSIDTGETSAVADEISHVADLRGRVTAANPEQRTFSVLHRTVRTTDATVEESDSAVDVAVGDLVEVSGYANASGELVASRVAIRPQDSGAQLRGTIAALDRNAHTFQIGTLLVDYAAASIVGPLTEGRIVVVQGDATEQLLVAKRIDVVAPLGAPGEKGDLESIITSFASAADFELNGQQVIGDEKTIYKLHGGALGPNATVRVKGHFADDGALIADKVELMIDPAAATARSAKAKAYTPR